MPRPSSQRTVALVLLALLLLQGMVPLAGALDRSVAAIKVAGSGEYREKTVQTYAGEVEGGPPAFDGRGIAIAVIDTGVDDRHPTFEGAWVAGAELEQPCTTEHCFKEERFDPVTGELRPHNPDDVHGHGTHVASIALGRGAGVQGQQGEDLARGVAPGARLVEVKVADDLGGASIADIARAIRWVVRYNEGNTSYGVPNYPVSVISLSMGSLSPKNGENAQERDAAMQAVQEATQAGVLVVVAAGNCGPGGEGTSVSVSCPPTVRRGDNTISSPGAAPEALTVGAMDDQGTVRRAGDVVAPYSSRGPNPASDPADDQWRKPDALAPGTRIGAACASPSDQSGERGRVCVKSGTTMAAPHVAGLAAILFQAGRYSDPDEGLTPEQVKQTILTSAEDWGPAGWDKAHGYGYVDGYAALVRIVNRAPVPRFSFQPQTPQAGDEVTFNAAGTLDPDDPDVVERLLWDFGDGTPIVETPGEDLVAHHTYDEAGSYRVTLKAIDNRGSSAKQVRVVTVREAPEDPGEPPRIQFTWSPTTPRADQRVAFDASGTIDPDGDGIRRYEWDFDHVRGQFAPDEKTLTPRANWTFDDHGRPDVALKVVDESGLSRILIKTVEVRPPPPGPPVVSFAHPQEGDQLKPGPQPVSWVVEENPADTFTVYLDGDPQGKVSGTRLLVDVPAGTHTLRLVAQGPGGTGEAQVSFTAGQTEGLQANSADRTDRGDDCYTHVTGDGRTERRCGPKPATQQDPSKAAEELAAQTGGNETPVPVLAVVLAVLVAGLARRRRGLL